MTKEDEDINKRLQGIFDKQQAADAKKESDKTATQKEADAQTAKARIVVATWPSKEQMLQEFISSANSGMKGGRRLHPRTVANKSSLEVANYVVYTKDPMRGGQPGKELFPQLRIVVYTNGLVDSVMKDRRGTSSKLDQLDLTQASDAQLKALIVSFIEAVLTDDT